MLTIKLSLPCEWMLLHLQVNALNAGIEIDSTANEHCDSL